MLRFFANLKKIKPSVKFEKNSRNAEVPRGQILVGQGFSRWQLTVDRRLLAVRRLSLLFLRLPGKNLAPCGIRLAGDAVCVRERKKEYESR